MPILKIREKEYVGLKSPIEGLALIKQVVEQYFGPMWTNYKPHCPLCNSQLQDFTKNMHKSVGNCPNSNCSAEIHPYDYFGKIIDVINMVEDEFGTLEELLKKKVSIEEKQPSRKKATRKKARPKVVKEVSVLEDLDSTEELIFDY